jgi:3-hydroxyacyl-[acyl-carrier-protein] dehydratase
MIFYFVDKILELEKGKYILTQTCIDGIEDYLNGSFSISSRIPHSLIVEALADSAALLVFSTTKFESMALLLMVNEATFKKPVVHGDRMLFDVRLTSLHENAAQLDGTIFVGDEEVTRSTLTLGLYPLQEITDTHIRETFSSLLQRCADFVNAQTIGPKPL